VEASIATWALQGGDGWRSASWLVTIESVVGIVIEGVFVAMLIQRLFR